jgi:hypothetical protein
MKGILSIAIALFFICSCDFGNEKKRIKNREVAMKTYCIGRHVVALPIEFSFVPIVTGVFKESNLGIGQRAIEVIVNTTEKGPKIFESIIDKRLAEIASISNVGINILREEKRIGDNAAMLRIQEVEDAYLSEMIILRGQALVTLRLVSYDNQYLSAEDRLLKLSEKITENNRSTEDDLGNGFCLGDISLTGDYSNESASFLFEDRMGADFDIKVDTYVKDDQIGLLSRMSSPNSLLTAFRVDHNVIRARKTIVAGMQAEEWLGWTMQGRDSNKKVFGFAMETVRPVPGKTAPKITISFDSRKKSNDQSLVDASIDDKIAVALWDSVINSMSSEYLKGK